MDQLPRIGITLEWQAGGGFSTLPWYACRQNYVDSVTRAGGLAWALPHEPRLADRYLDHLDGVLVTSGPFDVDPSYYSGGPRHAATFTQDRRTAFEFALIKEALARDLPILGIGGGHQLLNVVFGGTLVQHIPDEVAGAIVHEQSTSRIEPSHPVELVAGTALQRIAGCMELHVNSAHHQAVGRPGAGILVNARAPDGVIEAIEAPGYRFALGVQWSPEFAACKADAALFAAFVAACREVPDDC
jgi:putative glutamine amidotransferase